MNRRDFLSGLAASAMLHGTVGCVGTRFEPTSRAAAAVREMLLRGRESGLFDDAVAGTERGAVAAVGAANGESLFEVASVSKVFTAAIAARLVEKGTLDPERPVLGEATVRDLATHTSGYTDGWMGRAGVYGKTWPFADDASYERAARTVEPSYPRGEKCVYACTNMILLGFFLEDMTGRDLDSLARELVWRPLGMESTTWRNISPADPRLVRIYTHGPRPLGTKGDENARNFSRPLGNAGAFTCANDLARFSDDLIAGRRFGKAYYELMLKPLVAIGARRRSFGWDMSQRALPEGVDGVCHSGYTGQYLAISPSLGRAAIVLTNLKADDAKRRGASYRMRRELAGLLIRS